MIQTLLNNKNFFFLFFFFAVIASCKIKDIARITRKYQEYVRQDCNFYLTITKNVPVVFHDLQNYQE